MGRARRLPVTPAMAVFDDVQRATHLIDYPATETTPPSTHCSPRADLGPHWLGRAGHEAGGSGGKAGKGVRDGVPLCLRHHATVCTRSHPWVVVQPPGWQDHPRPIARCIRDYRATPPTEGPDKGGRQGVVREEILTAPPGKIRCPGLHVRREGGPAKFATNQTMAMPHRSGAVCDRIHHRPTQTTAMHPCVFLDHHCPPSGMRPCQPLHEAFYRVKEQHWSRTPKLSRR